MYVKAGRSADEAFGDFRQRFRRQTRVHFVFRIVFAVVVGRPIFGELAQVRGLGQFAGLALLFLVFLFDGVGHSVRGDACLLGVDLPKRWMVLDAFVEAGLRNGRVVHFAVAVAAIADQIDDHIGIEFGSILGGEAADTHDSVGIF